MSFNGNMEYQKSITKELLAVKDRVEYFIGYSHHGENGGYREIILKNYLKKVLPKNVSVGTGFVKTSNKMTKQIDIIIYDNSRPTLFSEGDFVIATPESILGIIEVKSTIRPGEKLEQMMKKANENGEIIGQNIFNGIFCYKMNPNGFINSPHHDTFKKNIAEHHGYVNHLAFGPNLFGKYWKEENPQINNSNETFSFYDIEDLAFGYFISNLIYTIHKKYDGIPLSEDYKSFLYPIDKGKEIYRIPNLEVNLNRGY
ncbi:DUF6602 domain-containing protein [Jeotgalibaca dankookensis]|uniref:DUF6602 domain-containing protein n=1 Tax=Jeotgalibaca dankookensis TaxID=708126 RepID=UPI0007813E5C|nr:DUF6602 domain-containing protein [Jeotgalibaca dankookensis]